MLEFWVDYAGVEDGREADEGEKECGDGELHALLAAFDENAFELGQQLEVKVCVVMVVYQVDQLRDKALAFNKLIWVFLSAGFRVIGQQRLGEVNQSVYRLDAVERSFVLDDGLNNSNCHSAFVVKLHVVHQSGIVMHLEDSNRQSVEWNGQQFDKEAHGGAI